MENSLPRLGTSIPLIPHINLTVMYEGGGRGSTGVKSDEGCEEFGSEMFLRDNDVWQAPPAQVGSLL